VVDLHNRRLLKPLALGTLAAVLAWLIVRSRPAPIASARITAITPGAVPIAHLALRYHNGARPIGVTCSVRIGDATGSTTLNGMTLYADVPLYGHPSGPWTISCMAAYRSRGWTELRSQQFHAPQESV
jgi:hypothetical protein